MKQLVKEDILLFLQNNKGILREKFGVINIGIMGSFARNEQTEESDIDFIVEFTEPNYSFLAGLTIFLENRFNRKIDIIRKRSNMRKSVKEVSDKEAIYA